MATHYSEPDSKGNFKVWYDTPEENPTYLEDGACIEIENGHKVIATLERIGPRQFDAEAGDIIEKLHAMAAAKLKPGTIYEIRGKLHNDYGRARGLAWYTCHEMQTWPTRTFVYPGKLNELGGYMVLGTFMVPSG